MTPASHVISNTNMGYSNYTKTLITTQYQATDANPTWTGGTSQTNTIISDNGLRVDGDLIIAVGYGDGFSIWQMENDGSMTNLYYVFMPDGSYQYYYSIALDTARGVAYIGNAAQDRITRIDYSAFKSGGGGPIGVIDNITQTANGLPADEVGYSYMNGLEIVGDYLYIVPDDASTTSVYRWNTQTETADNVTVVNRRNSGIRGNNFYDATNDRLYQSFWSSGEVWVTTDASLSVAGGAKAYCIRVYDALGQAPACIQEELSRIKMILI